MIVNTLGTRPDQGFALMGEKAAGVTQTVLIPFRCGVIPQPPAK